MDKPSLVVVGTGIRIIGQLTTESAAWIQIADRVLYLVHDPVADEIIRQMNSRAEPLAGHFAEGKSRKESLDEIVAHVMDSVRGGAQTCFALYGHPGVYASIGHEAIRQARAPGYTARMLPAISAEACLFADLGLDPGASGCQSYETKDFLVNGRRADPSSLLILWQVGIMGNPLYQGHARQPETLPVLIERLLEDYAPDHEVIAYEAAVHFDGEPRIERVALGQLAGIRLSATSTLCVPPSRPPRPAAKMCERLGLPLPVAPKS
jgi:hypothetical protein